MPAEVAVLRSPDHAVVGATDLEAVAGFLGALGFTERSDADLTAEAARALYGLDVVTPTAFLRCPGAVSGGIRVVAGSSPGRPPAPFDRGPTALDLYTTDIEASLEVAAAAGARCGPIGRYGAGPLRLAEARAIGPDQTTVVFIEASTRRPSLLDLDPDRLHSQVHSIVWAVDDLDATARFWHDIGLQVMADLTLADASIAAFLELPRPDAPLRLRLLCDEATAPSRLELLEYPEDAGRPRQDGRFPAGLYAAAFTVSDVPAACRALAGAAFGPPVLLHGRTAVAGEAPGGVRFELWDVAPPQ